MLTLKIDAAEKKRRGRRGPHKRTRIGHGYFRKFLLIMSGSNILKSVPRQSRRGGKGSDGVSTDIQSLNYLLKISGLYMLAVEGLQSQILKMSQLENMRLKSNI
jgi:hypothetical protein